MKEEQLRSLAEEYLRPLIPGASILPGNEPARKRTKRVAFVGPCTIGFRGDTPDNYRLRLHRSQRFTNKHTGGISELRVVEAFVKVVSGMKYGLTAWYHPDLRTTFPRRVVAKALCNDKAAEEAVLAGIDQLSLWAGQQYEGKPIAAAIGYCPDVAAGSVSLRDMCDEDFSAVLTNGFDTLLKCNSRGEVMGYETLPSPPSSLPYTPYRHASIAAWAADGRIALVLNRAGEILVFTSNELRFTRRRGHWHFLTHNSIVTQMGGKTKRELRAAVYATCLDASFARTGACVGIVEAGHSREWRTLVPLADDHLNPAKSTKAKVIASIVGTRKFHSLDRRLRQELVAIDGATLVDRKGTVLAVGAILKIDGGSEGGGRLAAAKALGKLGVGIKVSQDGGIRGYRGDEADLKFSVM